jgi:hypothetical protein
MNSMHSEAGRADVDVLLLFILIFISHGLQHSLNDMLSQNCILNCIYTAIHPGISIGLPVLIGIRIDRTATVARLHIIVIFQLFQM